MPIYIIYIYLKTIRIKLAYISVNSFSENKGQKSVVETYKVISSAATARDWVSTAGLNNVCACVSSRSQATNSTDQKFVGESDLFAIFVLVLKENPTR